MQKYGEFTFEQEDRIMEIYDAFEKAVQTMLTMPEDVAKKNNVTKSPNPGFVRGYAMVLAESVARRLTGGGHAVYFPWEDEETGIHDIYED